jgi:hypothetical protein
MQQSNALRRLEVVLSEAVENGDGAQPAGSILLKAMDLSIDPNNIVNFYELLNKARQEAGKIKDVPKISRYINPLEDLSKLFVVHHLWNINWATFANPIESGNVLSVLNSLADYYHNQNPVKFLEEEYLVELSSNFQSFLNEILDSDLSKELKIFLIKRIEDILIAIRRYRIDGAEGIEIAAKLLLSDLFIAGPTLNEKDKKNPIYNRVIAFVLKVSLVCSNPLIGNIPAIEQYWGPKIIETPKEIPIIQKTIDTFTNAFNEQTPEIVDVIDQNALESGEEEPKTAID